jgi:hypothetical protein
MKKIFSSVLVSTILATSVGAKDLQIKINETDNNFVLSVKSEDIKKSSSNEVLNLYSLLVADKSLSGKDFKFQSVYSKIELNCKDGTGVITSDYFEGKDITAAKVASSKAPQKIVSGEHAFFPKDLAFLVCSEAKAMGLASEPGAVLQPDLLPGGEQPAALELRVIQTRLYETNLNDFTEAYKEMCKNGGGNFYGSIKLCQFVKLKGFTKFPDGKITIEGEVETIDPSRIKLRIRIKDMRDKPAYNKFVYAAVFKEISDSLGILGIPIDVKKAE